MLSHFNGYHFRAKHFETISGVTEVVGVGEVELSVTADAAAQHGVTGTAAAEIRVTAEAIGGDLFQGSGHAEIKIEVEATGAHGVTGTGAVTLAVSAEALGEHTPAVVQPPSGITSDGLGSTWASIHFQDAIRRHKLLPVTGVGEVVLSLVAKAKGEHKPAVTGNGAVVIGLHPEADGEFFDAVGADNDFLLMLAA